MYRTWLGYDQHHESQCLKSSIKFCRLNDLVGIVGYGVPMITRPVLISATKERGLVVVVFGIGDSALAVQRGCDGAVQDGIFRYCNQDGN
jgi:hypothetical protein